MRLFPGGGEILAAVDRNKGSPKRLIEAAMVSCGRRGTPAVESRVWVEGTDQSFTEYLAPPREKGTKMLKQQDRLWTYSPATDRIIQISGAMLRQSVMGSDLSYEDLMEDPELQNLYNAEVVGTESLLGRECWLLQLTARVEDIAYHSRRIWVDRERDLVLKENRYAKSGKLLKTTEVKNVIEKGGRWVAQRVLFRDVLKKGGGTEFVLHDIEYDIEIPPHIFSKAALRK